MNSILLPQIGAPVSQRWGLQSIDMHGERERKRPQVRHFLVQGLLGAGGTSFVYRARHREFGDCVLKVVRKDYSAQPAPCLRIQREAVIARHLAHPSVPTVFGHGISEDGRPYLVMELLQGVTLDAQIRMAGDRAVENSTYICGTVTADT